MDELPTEITEEFARHEAAIRTLFVKYPRHGQLMSTTLLGLAVVTCDALGVDVDAKMRELLVARSKITGRTGP